MSNNLDKNAMQDADAVLIIKQALLKRHIQLWKPPYYGVAQALQALQELAGTLFKDDEKKGAVPAGTILPHLIDFQQRALSKLEQKGKLWKMVKLKIPSCGSATLQIISDFPATWAGNVVVESTQNTAAASSASSQKTIIIQLHQPNPDLSIGELVSDLKRKVLRVANNDSNDQDSKLQHKDDQNKARGAAAHDKSSPNRNEIIKAVRMIHKGTTLRDDTCLSQLGGGKNGKTTATILCLVQTGTATVVDSKASQSRDEILIAQVRTAAGRLQSRLDITDATGNLVAAAFHKEQDRLTLLTALALQTIGKQRMMATSQNTNTTAPSSSAQQEDASSSWESALVFLLQADQEWETLDDSWKTRVDNYGLLQLDICWIYLQLQSLDQLPNVVRRLEAAETALRKQVHVNFVTLALVQAELQDNVPALAAIFVRLFLLQGVAFHYQALAEDESTKNAKNSSRTKSQERLEWAWALAKSLRQASPPETVAHLCQVMASSTTPAQVISALRRTNGDKNRAVNLLHEEMALAQKAHQERMLQGMYGMCQNGMDHVHLDRLQQLKPLLGLEEHYGKEDQHGESADDTLSSSAAAAVAVATSSSTTSRDHGEDADDYAEWIAAGLLRLSNNDLEAALDRYQSCQRNVLVILEQVAALDVSQGRRQESTASPNKRRRPTPHVDEMALASLQSIMGVDTDKARQALERHDNDVERAMVWITTTTATTSDTEEEEETKKSSGPSCGSKASSSSFVESNEHGNQQAEATNGARSSSPAAQEEEPADDEAHEREEEEADNLLEEVLAQVLGHPPEQHESSSIQHYGGKGDDQVLGSSLDEEWQYLGIFRGQQP